MSPATQPCTGPINFRVVDLQGRVTTELTSNPRFTFEEFLCRLSEVSGVLTHEIVDSIRLQDNESGSTSIHVLWWFRIVKKVGFNSFDGVTSQHDTQQSCWQILDNYAAYDMLLAEMTLGINTRDSVVELKYNLPKHRVTARKSLASKEQSSLISLTSSPALYDIQSLHQIDHSVPSGNGTTFVCVESNSKDSTSKFFDHSEKENIMLPRKSSAFEGLVQDSYSPLPSLVAEPSISSEASRLFTAFRDQAQVSFSDPANDMSPQDDCEVFLSDLLPETFQVIEKGYYSQNASVRAKQIHTHCKEYLRREPSSSPMSITDQTHRWARFPKIIPRHSPFPAQIGEMTLDTIHALRKFQQEWQNSVMDEDDGDNDLHQEVLTFEDSPVLHQPFATSFFPLPTMANLPISLDVSEDVALYVSPYRSSRDCSASNQSQDIPMFDFKVPYATKTSLNEEPNFALQPTTSLPNTTKLGYISNSLSVQDLEAYQSAILGTTGCDEFAQYVSRKPVTVPKEPVIGKRPNRKVCKINSRARKPTQAKAAQENMESTGKEDKRPPSTTRPANERAKKVQRRRVNRSRTESNNANPTEGHPTSRAPRRTRTKSPRKSGRKQPTEA